MKLNIGSSDPRGKYKAPEWVNLDLFRFEGIDVLGNGEFLPFKDDSFDEIHMVHVLEHLRRDRPPVMLKEAYRVLCPGGVVFVETPDFRRIIENLHIAFWRDDKHNIHIWTTSCFGKSDRVGMEHYWGYTEDTMVPLLSAAGFCEVRATDEMISTHYKQEPVLLVVGRK